MNQIMKTLASKAKTTIEQTAQTVREKLGNIGLKPSLCLDEIASFIATHPDVTFETKEFLGFKYYFYTLTVNDLTFFLETRGGSGNYILKLQITSTEDTLYSYHSYQDKQSLTEPIRLCTEITDTINGEREA
ncbi:hypothetical protein LCL95_07420 [Bacillus timonensis]|nr:hypothetical protein [Bacillus timonensis]